MNTPPWLLKIVASYLTDRSMTLTFKGAQSQRRDLPSGCPQGALLGGLIFMIKFNGAFLRPSVPRNHLLQDARTERVKYVDDGSVAASINLKSYLIPDPSQRPIPLNFRERCQLVLPAENNPLQYILTDTEKFARENKMVINMKKTEAMLFTSTKTLDFPPELQFEDGSLMQTTSEKIILGVVITDDLKWKKNTQFIVSKARAKVWMLRRLQPYKLTIHELFDVYIKEVRSILEFAVPVWHSGLTKKQSKEIESVQKLAFKIILRNTYTSYSSACETFNTETLEKRRHELCLRFARKNIKSENCLFTFPSHSVNLRQRNRKVNNFKCFTSRFQRSSLPFLADLINSEC